VSEEVSDSKQALETAVIDAENAAKLLRFADRGSASEDGVMLKA
jgi:hypothetical protein